MLDKMVGRERAEAAESDRKRREERERVEKFEQSLTEVERAKNFDLKDQIKALMTEDYSLRQAWVRAEQMKSISKIDHKKQSDDAQRMSEVTNRIRKLQLEIKVLERKFREAKSLA